MIQFGKKTKGKGFNFAKTEDEAKPDTMADLSPEERAKAEAYRERQAQEQKRYTEATDSEFWLALCFHTLADLDAFSAEFGFGALHARILGEVAERALEYRKPESRKIGFGAASFGKSNPLTAAKTPDPLADVEYTGNLEADCLAEFAALHQALVQARQPEKMRDVTDSETWFVIVFKNRDHKERFLEDFNLAGLGDKYIDGENVAKKLRR